MRFPPSYDLIGNLIVELYWCGIPLSCRECAFLEQCRKGFFGWRKCYNGCIKLNKKREWEREENRELNWQSLLDYAEEQDRKGRKKL